MKTSTLNLMAILTIFSENIVVPVVVSRIITAMVAQNSAGRALGLIGGLMTAILLDILTAGLNINGDTLRSNITRAQLAVIMHRFWYHSHRCHPLGDLTQKATA